MEETNDETTPGGEESTEAEERAEQASTEGERGKRRCGCLCGLLSGAAVGGVLAWLLAPKRSEESARREMIESGRWESREEGGGRPTVASRAEAAVGGVVSRLVVFWAAFRERLRDAVEEGRDGVAEGQAEARARYEFMTKRRRPRR